MTAQPDETEGDREGDRKLCKAPHTKEEWIIFAYTASVHPIHSGTFLSGADIITIDRIILWWLQNVYLNHHAVNNSNGTTAQIISSVTSVNKLHYTHTHINIITKDSQMYTEKYSDNLFN